MRLLDFLPIIIRQEFLSVKKFPITGSTKTVKLGKIAIGLCDEFIDMYQAIYEIGRELEKSTIPDIWHIITEKRLSSYGHSIPENTDDSVKVIVGVGDLRTEYDRWKLSILVQTKTT